MPARGCYGAETCPADPIIGQLRAKNGTAARLSRWKHDRSPSNASGDGDDFAVTDVAGFDPAGGPGFAAACIGKGRSDAHRAIVGGVYPCQPAPDDGIRHLPVRHRYPVSGLTAEDIPGPETRSEEHTSELQSLMRIPYAGFCL